MRTSTGDWPDCPFLKADCFAFENIGMACSVLSNTHFDGRKECPFYKTRSQLVMDEEKAKRRLAERMKANERKSESDADGQSGL